MRAALVAGIAIAVLAWTGWAIRDAVAAETRVRAKVAAPGAILGNAAPEATVSQLISILQTDGAPPRRVAAAELLATAPSQDAARALLRAIADPDPAVQAAAVRSIGSHASRVEALLRDLPTSEAEAGLRSCPPTSLLWLFELALRASPERAEALSRAALPRFASNQVTWVAMTLDRCLWGSTSTFRVPPSDEARRRVVACLLAGLESPSDVVRALFAVEVATRGGPLPTDAQVKVLLGSFHQDGEFHQFFRRVADWSSARVQKWARWVIGGERSTGVFWTLLALDSTLGRERTVALAREGLANPEPAVQRECQKWLTEWARDGK